MNKTKKMLASEFAKENNREEFNFKWWDTKEGLITIERYKEIEKLIYGGKA